MKHKQWKNVNLVRNEAKKSNTNGEAQTKYNVNLGTGVRSKTQTKQSILFKNQRSAQRVKSTLNY